MSELAAIAESLTSAELDLLTECEDTISRGLETFREVGEALTAVRENRLYRAEFLTFEAYAEARWSLSGRRINQLINASLVGTIVPEIKNEAQARELASLLDNPDQIRSAYDEAVKRTNGKPTAAAIRDVLTERDQPEPSERFSEAFDKAAERKEMIEGHNELAASMRRDLTPERIAEIEESVRPAVQFGQLVAVCEDFVERLGRVDLAYAARGMDPLRKSAIEQAVDRLVVLRKTLEATA